MGDIGAWLMNVAHLNWAACIASNKIAYIAIGAIVNDDDIESYVVRAILSYAGIERSFEAFWPIERADYNRRVQGFISFLIRLKRSLPPLF